MRPKRAKGYTERFRAHIEPLEKHPLFDTYGILPETVREFGCGRVRTPAMGDRIVFPIHSEDGTVVAVAGQSSTGAPPEYVFDPAQMKGAVVLNLHRAIEAARSSREKTVIIVSGALDCMKIHQAGFRRVVAILGPVLTEEQEVIIVEHFDQVLLMLPGTDEGWRATQDAVSRLALQAYVKAVVMPSRKAPHELQDGEIQDIVRIMAR